MFLSHCREDVDFIKKLYDDLRRCQIDPWLDSEEIRHGQPWLDAIFESGIPTCDGVLVYLTANSIQSRMVKKEIDAGLIQKLSDNHVGFLPYVSEEPLRSELRPDLQSLQVPVWNAANYNRLLPRVVAEIWHSYMDRTVSRAASEERARRLEAELALQKMRQEREGHIFSPAEEKDFRFIYEALNREEDTSYSIIEIIGGTQEEEVDNATYTVNALTVVLELVERGYQYFNDGRVSELLCEWMIPLHPETQALSGGVFLSARIPPLKDEILMFGLLQHSRVMESAQHYDGGRRGYHQVATHRLDFTEKMQRFRYWLVVEDLMPEHARLVSKKPFDRIEAWHSS